MSEASDSRAWWVSQAGGEGRVVLASHPLAALVEALRVDADIDAIARLEAQRRSDGWAARVDGVVWTVRAHRAADGSGPDTVLRASDEVTACRRALRAAREAVPSDSGAVLLVEGRYLRFVWADGPQGEALIGVRLPVTTGLAGYAAQTHQPQIVADASAHPRHYRALDTITGYDTRQILAVPALSGGAVHGVIELMNPPGARGFTRLDAARVERIASVLAGWLARRRAGAPPG